MARLPRGGASQGTGPRRARGRCLALAVATIAAPVTGVALPADTPWGRADGEACHDCHFLNPVVESSQALALDGVPERFVTGETYRLVLELTAPEMGRAGFRVVASTTRGAPGTFAAVDGDTESDGDRVRSTLAGSELDSPGRARWTFVWRAPEDEPETPVTLEISANAADDDASPLGDVIHRRRITIEPAAQLMP